MKRPSLVLLVLSAGLYLAWIGWLAFLALTTRHPVVLSRPQLLVSNLDVSAKVDSLDGPVTICTVFSTPQTGDAAREGAQIEVQNLTSCDKDWHGPGRYLLPLNHAPGSGNFRVVAIPRSPGFPGDLPRIYPDTPQTRAHLEQILRE